jgi:Protein of unknown function (DUF1236)
LFSLSTGADPPLREQEPSAYRYTATKAASTLEQVMKHLLIAGSAAALLASGYVMAQDTTLTIEPAHRTIIKQYIVKEHVRPAPIRETVAVGTVLPEDVTLQPVPSAWTSSVPEVSSYDYVDWNGKVVFVEPKTRKVVSIVD